MDRSWLSADLIWFIHRNHIDLFLKYNSSSKTRTFFVRRIWKKKQLPHLLPWLRNTNLKWQYGSNVKALGKLTETRCWIYLIRCCFLRSHSNGVSGIATDLCCRTFVTRLLFLRYITLFNSSCLSPCTICSLWSRYECFTFKESIH